MPAPFVKYAFFFPFYIFCFFVKNQVFLGVKIDIQVFATVIKAAWHWHKNACFLILDLITDIHFIFWMSPSIS